VITHERLKAVLSYDKTSGVFTWKTRVSNRIHVHDNAGSIGNFGYLYIRIDGVLYRAHRLAWFYVHSVWPKNQIDHINHNPANNAISNLRDVSNAENCQNLISAKKNNQSTGLLGAYFHKQSGKYRAMIGVNGKTRSLGLFATPQEAHDAYVSAKRLLHPSGIL
jgi:hypothetical protein